MIQENRGMLIQNGFDGFEKIHFRTVMEMNNFYIYRKKYIIWYKLGHRVVTWC